jgi:hypothetical protein
MLRGSIIKCISINLVAVLIIIVAVAAYSYGYTNNTISEIRNESTSIMMTPQLQSSSPPSQVPSAHIQRSLESIPEGTMMGANCSYGWFVTGYSIPLESDFEGEPMKVIRVGGQNISFPQGFIEKVNVDGWGRTNRGYYLGYNFSGGYLLDTRPLGSKNNTLLIGDVATDYKVIPYGSKVTISSLPLPWNKKVLTAHDMGPAIKGKHIDVFTGIGQGADNETKRVTGHNNTVCWK